MNITKPKNRKDKEEIHKELEKIDSAIIKSYQATFGFEKHFVLKRDKELMKKIRDNLEWCENNTLLLMGRIRTSELGVRIFTDGKQYLQFNTKRKYDSNKKRIPLSEANYQGAMFKRFVQDPRLGAKADVSREDGAIITIFIPEVHRNKIIYN